MNQLLLFFLRIGQMDSSFLNPLSLLYFWRFINNLQSMYLNLFIYNRWINNFIYCLYCLFSMFINSINCSRLNYWFGRIVWKLGLPNTSLQLFRPFVPPEKMMAMYSSVYSMFYGNPKAFLPRWFSTDFADYFMPYKWTDFYNPSPREKHWNDILILTNSRWLNTIIKALITIILQMIGPIPGLLLHPQICRKESPWYSIMPIPI